MKYFGYDFFQGRNYQIVNDFRDSNGNPSDTWLKEKNSGAFYKIDENGVAYKWDSTECKVIECGPGAVPSSLIADLKELDRKLAEKAENLITGGN